MHQLPGEGCSLMSAFWHNFAGTIIDPYSTFAGMKNDANIFPESFIYFTVTGFIYFVIVIVFIRVKFTPWYKPLLKIAPEKYYFAELFFQMPVTTLCFVMTAGFIRIVSGFFGAAGTVKLIVLFAILVYALFVPILIWLLHDAVYAVLFLSKLFTPERFHESFRSKGFVFIINTLVIAVTAVWHGLLLVTAVNAVEGLGIGSSIITGILSLTVFYSIWVVVFQR